MLPAMQLLKPLVEATRLGAYDYISKPFTPEELLLPVKNGLKKRALDLEARSCVMNVNPRLLEISHERTKCATIINCIVDGVVVVNLENQIVLRNSAALKILPWEANSKLPYPLLLLDCSDLRDMLCKTLASSSNPNIVTKEISIGSLTYMVNASPVIDPEGSVLGGVAVNEGHYFSQRTCCGQVNLRFNGSSRVKKSACSY